MNPDQALQILDEASAIARLTRSGHYQVQQALIVLKQAVKPQANSAGQTKPKKGS